jgi:hypothetical protein
MLCLFSDTDAGRRYRRVALVRTPSMIDVVGMGRPVYEDPNNIAFWAVRPSFNCEFVANHADRLRTRWHKRVATVLRRYDLGPGMDRDEIATYLADTGRDRSRMVQSVDALVLAGIATTDVNTSVFVRRYKLVNPELFDVFERLTSQELRAVASIKRVVCLAVLGQSGNEPRIALRVMEHPLIRWTERPQFGILEHGGLTESIRPSGTRRERYIRATERGGEILAALAKVSPPPPPVTACGD